jgi:hypothetical protein
MLSKITLGARLLLGLIFTLFGINGFFQFLPMPPLSPEAGIFLGSLVGTGYMLTFLKASEMFCGLLLLTNTYVPLALLILAPITLNILAFHLFLDPPNVGIGIIVVSLNIFLGWSYRRYFREALTAKAHPN